MKPIERLHNNYPEELVLIHEAGHVVLGHARKLTEGGIEFLVENPCEVARAHWQETGATIDDKVIRSLAGIFIQSLVIPNSIDKSLINLLSRDRITAANLASFGNLLGQNRCAGDWHKITEVFRREMVSEADQVVILNRCLDELRRVVERKSLVKTAEHVAKDIKLWLETEDEDMGYAPMIIYPVTRSRQIFAKVQSFA